MRQICMVTIILFLFFTPMLSEELKRLNLDDASTIGLHIQADEVEKTEGRASLRISTLWPTSVCLGEVTGLDFSQARLVFQAKVKSRMKGMAYLEMWVHFPKGQYFSRGLNRPVKDRSEWTTLETPFLLQKGQVPEKITLNLVINGVGTVWIDDIVILKENL